MVYCCVPNCDSSSWKNDDSIIFHDFPPNPDLAAKWIKHVNNAINSKPMWFPRGKAVICNKHFMKSAYKTNSNELKPRAMPTIFGQKFIPTLKANEETLLKKADFTSSPLIVKVNKPEETNNSGLHISNVFSQAKIKDSVSLTPDSSELNTTVPTQQYDIKPLISSSADNGQNQNAFYSTVNYIMQNNIHPSINFTNQLTCVSNVHSINTTKQVQNVSNTYPSVTQQLQNSSNIQPPINVTQELSNISNTTPSTNVTRPLQNVSNTHPSINIAKRLQNAISNKMRLNDKELSTANKKQKVNNELIEIGPNTFLKINPDVIKVNKKQTPSGNTVLQFVMNPKMALNSNSMSPFSFTNENNNSANNLSPQNSMDLKCDIQRNGNKELMEENVVGHLLDTRSCEISCSKNSIENENQDDDDVQIIENDTINSNKNQLENGKPNFNIVTNTDPCIAKAPILMTTNMPLNNYMLGGPKYSSLLRQKSRLIASLRIKVDKLTKKVEELEDKCIVQERQLSYSFIKRLKSVRKNAAKGDRWATYILEQIRSYSGRSKMRWSDSTLTQCAIWCRKAPYAYEYFKKANLFKLPCLATVKRFRKKHPEINFTNKVNGININPDDDDSSDFTFEESNSENENQEVSDDENFENVPCETILSVPSDATNFNHIGKNNMPKKNDSNENTTLNIESAPHDEQISNVKDIESQKQTDENASKIDHNQNEMEDNNVEDHNQNEMEEDNVEDHNQNEMEDNNVEIQEIILPSGEIVQFNSVVCNTTESGSQYYIIPAINDQNYTNDHQYSVVTSESLPLVLQNIDSSELPIEQDQLIFITNSEQIDSPKSQT